MSLPFQRDKPLSSLSTFGIGGPARFFTEVTEIEQMADVLRTAHARSLRVLVIGKGSNTLFDDRGFDGLVILNKITFCEQNEALVKVGAGYSFSLLGVQTARRGWSGLEFASGIPASVGGAVYMNAGANGAETCDALKSVTVFSEKGELKTYAKEELCFSYRFSSFQERKEAIVAATFELKPLDSARKKQLEIVEYRLRTQPYGDKSAGCVFRNPDGFSAGALIDGSGLKGTSVGGAKVSELHANFIINKEGARAEDVLKLAALIQQRVKELKGIELEREIRCIPYQLEN
jgi:UDP-N-acetylmuramate dehydrogenase